MAEATEGFVLRAPRTAPANAVTTGESDNGVSRDHKPTPGSYDYNSELIEPDADQYRAAVLLNPSAEEDEYLLWAANSSNLALIEDTSWAEAYTQEAPDIVSIPNGGLTVTDTTISPQTREDGTLNLVVTDLGDRSLADIRLIEIERGDTGAHTQIGPDASGGAPYYGTQDADAGLITLSTQAQTDLGGGVSASRGDLIVSVSYVVAASRYWWTRNDKDVERFHWNGKVNRWEPIKGTAPLDLNILTEDAEFTLIPRPTRFQVGDTLPYDPTNDDAFALIRVGIRPDALANAPEVLVVSDVDVEEDYPFAGPTPDAVVGVTNGILQFNPVYIEVNAGQTVWYNPEQFNPDATGSIGDLIDAEEDPLFLSPIPGPTDNPRVKIGFRRYLTSIGVDDDAELAATPVSSGSVAWSKSTGKLKFNPTDVAKSDPTDPSFDIRFLGAVVYYDGVTMSSSSIGTTEPVQLVDDTGVPAVVDTSNDLYLPDALPLPAPGVSGVLFVPDGTGTTPNTSIAPSTRPNGSGLIREIEGFGDIILFGKAGALEQIIVVEFESELPDFPFQIPEGTAFIAREKGTQGSKVMLGRKDRQRFDGQYIYFLQAEVQPAVYATKARFYSRERGSFEVVGTEKLYFAVDGLMVIWDASVLGAGTYSASQIAADIDALMPVGRAYADRDHVVLEAADADLGTLEVGFGPTGLIEDRDLSGCALLGFMPTWRVDAPSTSPDWLPDNGSSLGVFRSPVNLDRSSQTPDTNARSRFEDEIFAEAVPPNPAFPLTNPPFRDVAGYDDDVFFRVVDGLNEEDMRHYEDVLYEFSLDRFMWLSQDSLTARVDRATSALPLGQVGVVGDTMYPAVDAANGLYVAEDGSTFILQTEGTDFLLPAGGIQGVANLIQVIGSVVDEGAAATFQQGGTTFFDPNALFITDGVQPGYRLKVLSGDAEGSYIVLSVTSETELEVEPGVPFLADAGPLYGAPFAPWRLFEGYSKDVYDPGLVADIQYEQFNHLLDEPFKIRTLEDIGSTPTDPSDQQTNRLFAEVTEGYQRGRQMSIRFSLDYGNPEATLTALQRGTEIGVLANGSLFIPNVLDPHFINENFAIRVGSKTYPVGTGAGTVEVVAVLTPGLTGDLIECLDTTGELNFGTTTLAELEGSFVAYDQEYLEPTALAAGQAEYNPNDGGINLSDADMAAHGGESAYFVQKMITEEREDVVISPLVGSFYFNRPLRAGQLVEAQYYQADVEGNQIGNEIIEFLPLIIRLEEATRVSAKIYTVNPSGRTIATNVDPLMWVDSQLQNYGNLNNVSFVNGTLTFNEDIDAAAVVQVNYGVYEAFGGEQAYNTSTIPVWRPPFFLEKDQSDFTVEGDRTSSLYPGVLMRLGAAPFYIKASVYNAGDNTTTVTVWPTPQNEAGSRAPGNDVLTLNTTQAVTTDVDGVPTPANAGFLLNTGATYEPVDKGMLSILFQGDLTANAVTGHLLEIGGYPFFIVNSELSDDGRTTRVDVTTPSPVALSPATDAAYISARPIYPPAPRVFLGISPIVASEGHELVLFGEIEDGIPQPGRTLTLGVDYQLNPDTGGIEFIEPVQSPLGSDEYVLLAYTRLKVLAPFVEDEAIIFPRYRAGYSYVDAPSEDNGRLGTVLKATYTFSNPDSFYYRTVPMLDYLGEVAQLAAKQVERQNPSGGPTIAIFGSTENKDQGNLGLKSQRRDLTDQDRAARAFISLYNEAIVAFEQILETIDGRVIGDWDGKFRFFIGRGRRYAPPGYEDPISGDLNARFVWDDVFFSVSGIHVMETDPVVDPQTATQNPTTKVVDGVPMDPFLLRLLVDRQKPLVANDMDDIVLAGVNRPRLTTAFPIPIFNIPGRFLSMWEPHRLSRLFPELTRAFTTTFPGLNADLTTGDPGVYSFLKMIPAPEGLKVPEGFPIAASTFARPIGAVANPALGVIENITDAFPRERLPRARVWAYYPNGSADLDAALGTTTDGFATVIATPLYLKDFPVDPDTGFPDVVRFLSQGGDLADLETGDGDLSTPAFLPLDTAAKIGQQVALGRPTGETYMVGAANKVISTAFGTISFNPIYGGVFIGTVQVGCVITLKDEDGNDLAGSDVLELGDTELSGTPIALEQGDTIYITPPGAKDASAMSDPPTVQDAEEFAKAQPNYRNGFDVAVQKRGGNFLDLTAPSIDDPAFPIKEMVGQRPPRPLSTIEADVEFVNNNRGPTNFPALQGQDVDDSGDHEIPYLGTSNTEIDRLREAQVAFNHIYADGPAPTPTQLWLSVYPDEILGVDGQILDAPTGVDPAATLLTSADLEPVGAGPYIANSGIGDMRSFDLLLVEKGQPNLPAGSTGILNVANDAALSPLGQIEVPRFVAVTGSSQGRYTHESAMAHLSTSFVSGMLLTSFFPFPNWTTIFDITSIAGAPVFNDDLGAGPVGGLNNILYPGSTNALVIRIYENGGGGAPGTLVETIVLTRNNAWGGLGAALGVTSLIIDDKLIFVDTVASFVASTGVIYDFTLEVDTFITPATSAATGGALLVGSGSGTPTQGVQADRLTWGDGYDMSSGLERGTTTAAPASLLVETRLSVWESTIAGVPGVTVNDPAACNGGSAFTFLPSLLGGPIGTFVGGGGTGNGYGTVKVPSWEGSNNTPLPGVNDDLIFSVVPSSEIDEQGEICKGTGLAPDGTTQINIDNSTITVGAVSRVQPGDTLVISRSAIPIVNPVNLRDGAVKTGTYLVRHAVEENSGFDYREKFLSGRAGAGEPWVQVVFPTVVSWNLGLLEVEISDTSGPGPGGTAWHGVGRLHIVIDPNDPTSVISMQYTGFVGNTFTMAAGSGLDATGGFVSDAAYFGALTVGVQVSGMRYLPVGTAYPSDLPENNVVGHDHGVTTAGGYLNCSISNSLMTGDVTVGPYFLTFTYGGGTLVDSSGGAYPGASNLGIGIATPADPRVFQVDRSLPVYNAVAEYIDIFGISGGQWQQVHGDAAIHGTGTGAVTTVLPTDKFVTTDVVDADGNPGGGATEGFRAQAGIFCEPTFPRPTRNLLQVVPHVVDAGTSATANSQVGMRDAATFGGLNPEPVSFEIRRIRRFHEALQDITDSLEPLRFAYEIRRGVIGIGSTTSSLVASTPTQLGDFEDADVNVNPGDTVRLLDANGNVTDEAEIGSITGANTLDMRDPGFETAPVAGTNFEIYLRQPPVPHEQSNEQLFDLAVEEVIHQTVPNYTTGDGGYAPINFDEFRDTTVPDFTALGVQQGDYVIIDPAGELEGPTGPANPVEYGSRPYGDQSVVERGPMPGPFVPGSPSELDDNRGFYRITNSPVDIVQVTGVSDFTGDIANRVIFGDSGQEFAVMPTISAGAEGQQSLRPTLPAGASSPDPNSYRGNQSSIQPFGYRIVRLSSLFTQETNELIFFVRERMLSWIEKISLVVEGTKSGDYYVFQRDEHILNLGSPTNPDEGLGVMSNAYIDNLQGKTDWAPFVNTSDCLSVLDRRYWVLDFNLDYEGPIGSSDYYASFTITAPGIPPLTAGSGRPVEPDRVDDVLDRDDRLRPLRFSWIRYRTDRVNGTLPAIVRFDAELPEREQEQEDLLRLKEGLDEA